MRTTRTSGARGAEARGRLCAQGAEDRGASLITFPDIYWALRRYLHGLTFQLIDAILFLDIRSIVVSLLKRVRTYLAYRDATHSLQHAYPDASADQDPCAICMERMQAAKQLPCGHLFHLACLRAWLQQSGSEQFACPLCRTPLMRGTPDARRRRRWPGAEAAERLAARMYLDVFVAVLLGLPLGPSAIHRPRQAVHRGQAGGGLRRGRRAVPQAALVEEVAESAHPSPAVLRGSSSARRTREAPAAGGWAWALARLRALLRGSLEPLGHGGLGAEVATRSDETSDDDSGLVDVDEPFATAGDGVWPEAPMRMRAWGGQHEVEEEAGESGDVAEDTRAGPSRVMAAAARPLMPLLPPPYLDPPTLSAGSVDVIFSVARSIRSTLGMGTRGPGAVAGIHHDTDEEVDSPLRLRPGRRRPGGSGQAPLAGQADAVESVGVEAGAEASPVVPQSGSVRPRLRARRPNAL